MSTGKYRQNGFKKVWPNYILSTGGLVQEASKGKTKLKVKGEKDMFHANSNKRDLGLLYISDKVNYVKQLYKTETDS